MPVRARRGRRPLGSPDARRAVLVAARDRFAELGFERPTMRAVASRAGVDPALIYHYFGDKDGLLFAALQPPVDAAAVFAGLADATDRTGEELVRRLIGLWEERSEIREQMRTNTVCARSSASSWWITPRSVNASSTGHNVSSST